MTFYTNLRDGTAASLLLKFGQAATLRQYGAQSYDVATGTNTPGAATDTAIQLAEITPQPQDFAEEEIAKAELVVIIGAKETAAASVSPAISDVVVLGGVNYTIGALKRVAPAGTAVVYKATLDAPS